MVPRPIVSPARRTAFSQLLPLLAIRCLPDCLPPKSAGLGQNCMLMRGDVCFMPLGSHRNSSISRQIGGNSQGSGGCWETRSSRNLARLSTRQLNPTFGSSSEPGGRRRGWYRCLPGLCFVSPQAGIRRGRRLQPPRFPTLPRLTSSANGKNPTQQPLRTQQPPCTESAAARPEERLTGAMTIKALILRANNAVFPQSGSPH